MKDNLILLKILFGVEIVLSVRVLLFTFPVMLQKFFSGAGESMGFDWKIIGFSVIAIIYFCVGLMSYQGYQLWKVAHYVAMVITIIITASIWSLISSSVNQSYMFVFFLPSIFAVLMSLYIASVKTGLRSLT